MVYIHPDHIQWLMHQCVFVKNGSFWLLRIVCLMPTFVYSHQVGKPCRNMRIKYCILKDYFTSNFSFNFLNPRHPTTPVVHKKTKYYTMYSICNSTFHTTEGTREHSHAEGPHL